MLRNVPPVSFVRSIRRMVGNLQLFDLPRRHVWLGSILVVFLFLGSGTPVIASSVAPQRAEGIQEDSSRQGQKVDVIFVIDMSWSMRAHLDAVRTGIRNAVSELVTDDSRVQVVLFNSEVRTWEPRIVSDISGRNAFNQDLDEILQSRYLGGKTWITGGLREGMEALSRFKRSEPERRRDLVLITDGQNNVGTDTFDDLLQDDRYRDLQPGLDWGLWYMTIGGAKLPPGLPGGSFDPNSGLFRHAWVSQASAPTGSVSTNQNGEWVVDLGAFPPGQLSTSIEVEIDSEPDARDERVEVTVQGDSGVNLNVKEVTLVGGIQSVQIPFQMESGARGESHQFRLLFRGVGHRLWVKNDRVNVRFRILGPGLMVAPASGLEFGSVPVGSGVWVERQIRLDPSETEGGDYHLKVGLSAPLPLGLEIEFPEDPVRISTQKGSIPVRVRLRAEALESNWAVPDLVLEPHGQILISPDRLPIRLSPSFPVFEVKPDSLIDFGVIPGGTKQTPEQEIRFRSDTREWNGRVSVSYQRESGATQVIATIPVANSEGEGRVRIPLGDGLPGEVRGTLSFESDPPGRFKPPSIAVQARVAEIFANFVPPTFGDEARAAGTVELLGTASVEAHELARGKTLRLGARLRNDSAGSTTLHIEPTEVRLEGGMQEVAVRLVLEQATPGTYFVDWSAEAESSQDIEAGVRGSASRILVEQPAVEFGLSKTSFQGKGSGQEFDFALTAFSNSVAVGRTVQVKVDRGQLPEAIELDLDLPTAGSEGAYLMELAQEATTSRFTLRLPEDVDEVPSGSHFFSLQVVDPSGVVSIIPEDPVQMEFDRILLTWVEILMASSGLVVLVVAVFLVASWILSKPRISGILEVASSPSGLGGTRHSLRRGRRWWARDVVTVGRSRPAGLIVGEPGLAPKHFQVRVTRFRSRRRFSIKALGGEVTVDGVLLAPGRSSTIFDQQRIEAGGASLVFDNPHARQES